MCVCGPSTWHINKQNWRAVNSDQGWFKLAQRFITHAVKLCGDDVYLVI